MKTGVRDTKLVTDGYTQERTHTLKRQTDEKNKF